MIVQVVTGPVGDAAVLEAAVRRVADRLRDLVGLTAGITGDGRLAAVARFAAGAPGHAWWEELRPGLGGPAEVRQSSDVEMVLGGGPPDAGFVEVIGGRTADRARFMALERQLEHGFAAARPDFLGSLLLWWPDGTWVEVAGFTSEAAVRAGDAQPLPPDVDRLVGEWEQVARPAWKLDLARPWPLRRRTQRQRMLDGDLYVADDPELAADALRARRLQDRFNRTDADAAGERRHILEALLGGIGEDSEIRPPFHCDYGYQISVGARVFVNFGLAALDVAPITIGDDVQIGPNVQLLTPTHPVGAGLRRAKWEAAEPITVEDNVWLGGGVIVLPGVRIGRNTVVGAGSVVARDLPADVVAMGSPARVARTL